MLPFKRPQVNEPVYYYSFNTDTKNDDLLHYIHKMFKMQLLVTEECTDKVFLTKFTYYFL